MPLWSQSNCFDSTLIQIHGWLSPRCPGQWSLLQPDKNPSNYRPTRPAGSPRSASTCSSHHNRKPDWLTDWLTPDEHNMAPTDSGNRDNLFLRSVPLSSPPCRFSLFLSLPRERRERAGVGENNPSTGPMTPAGEAQCHFFFFFFLFFLVFSSFWFFFFSLCLSRPLHVSLTWQIIEIKKQKKGRGMDGNRAVFSPCR